MALDLQRLAHRRLCRQELVRPVVPHVEEEKDWSSCRHIPYRPSVLCILSVYLSVISVSLQSALYLLILLPYTTPLRYLATSMMLISPLPTFTLSV